jgi:hypothetical protein
LTAESKPTKARDPLRTEIVIATVMLAFGLFVLPMAIYAVGVRVIGEYGGEGGLLDFAESIWTDLLSLTPWTWILVLSPYVVVQALRFARRLLSTPRAL